MLGTIQDGSLHVLHVLHHAGRDVTALAPVVKGHRQFKQFVMQVSSQIEDDFLFEDIVDPNAHAVKGFPGEEKSRDEHNAIDQDSCHAVSIPNVFVEHLVEDGLNYLWHGNRKSRHGNRHEQSEAKQSLVAKQVAADSPDDTHRFDVAREGIDSLIIAFRFKRFSMMDANADLSEQEDGPTGAILSDLPSPYQAHKNGLLHLPRFIAKIRKHLADELPKSYQRNFTKGFDGFLCLHLGIDPKDVVSAVLESEGEEELEERLLEILPQKLRVHVWNRKLVQMGMSQMGREKLAEVKQDMGIPEREDLISFADLIEYDEGRIR
mgnify:CR=1 FL=1